MKKLTKFLLFVPGIFFILGTFLHSCSSIDEQIATPPSQASMEVYNYLENFPNFVIESYIKQNFDFTNTKVFLNAPFVLADNFFAFTDKTKYKTGDLSREYIANAANFSKFINISLSSLHSNWYDSVYRFDIVYRQRIDKIVANCLKRTILCPDDVYKVAGDLQQSLTLAASYNDIELFYWTSIIPNFNNDSEWYDIELTKNDILFYLEQYTKAYPTANLSTNYTLAELKEVLTTLGIEFSDFKFKFLISKINRPWFTFNDYNLINSLSKQNNITYYYPESILVISELKINFKLKIDATFIRNYKKNISDESAIIGIIYSKF